MGRKLSVVDDGLFLFKGIDTAHGLTVLYTNVIAYPKHRQRFVLFFDYRLFLLYFLFLPNVFYLVPRLLGDFGLFHTFGLGYCGGFFLSFTIFGLNNL